MAELAEETKEALLTAIKEMAPKEVRAEALQQLATAYAMTVGAARTRLPGYTPPTSSS